VRATAWRPTAALRKRRGVSLSLLDASGVAALFVFFLAVYLVRSAVTDAPIDRSVELAAALHARPLPAGLKEDAIAVGVMRDGMLYFGATHVKAEGLPALIRSAYEHGAERKIYLRVDARAKYAAVERAIDLIRQSGVQDVAFIVEQARQPNP